MTTKKPEHPSNRIPRKKTGFLPMLSGVLERTGKFVIVQGKLRVKADDYVWALNHAHQMKGWRTKVQRRRQQNGVRENRYQRRFRLLMDRLKAAERVDAAVS
jgi:tRNA (Thr-GGU) A37 N-methylase